MKKIAFLFIFAFIAKQLAAQNKGDQHRKEGNLEKAIQAYTATYMSNPTAKNNTYNLACAYALTHQKDSAFHYLSIALQNDDSLWALADNDLLSLTKDTRWKSIEQQQFVKYQKKKAPIEKPEYAKQLLRLIMKDQALDYQLDMAKRYFMKNGKAPHWYYPIAAMKKEIGSGNFAEMKQLIAKNGWPTYAAVGKLAADGPLLIINHHPEEAVRIQYLPQIKKACLQQQGSCMEYAKIQDRILVNTGKPQRYGMQFRYNKNRTLEPFPVKDPEYVDQRRKAIGLPPLKQYLKRKINYDWSIPQKKK
jgi:hypothetical protein